MCSCGQAKTVQRDIVGVVNNFATDNMECVHPEIDTDCDNVRIGHGLRSCRCRGPYVLLSGRGPCQGALVLLLLMHSVSGAWKEWSFLPRWCCWDRIWEAHAIVDIGALALRGSIWSPTQLGFALCAGECDI
jgi:hypothetical protein